MTDAPTQAIPDRIYALRTGLTGSRRTMAYTHWSGEVMPFNWASVGKPEIQLFLFSRGWLLYRFERAMIGEKRPGRRRLGQHSVSMLFDGC